MTKTASMSFSLSNSSQKSSFFAVLMYPLYGHPGYFKFKGKHPQYYPCFQTILMFLMTMLASTSAFEYRDFVKSVNLNEVATYRLGAYSFLVKCLSKLSQRKFPKNF